MMDKLLHVRVDVGEDRELIAGLTKARINFNRQAVDVTSLESKEGWRECLDGGGTMSVTISGGCLLTDRGEDIAFSGKSCQFSVFVPDYGTIEGPFMFSNVARDLNLEPYDPPIYDVTIVSTGEVTTFPLDGKG